MIPPELQRMKKKKRWRRLRDASRRLKIRLFFPSFFSFSPSSGQQRASRVPRKRGSWISSDREKNERSILLHTAAGLLPFHNLSQSMLSAVCAAEKTKKTEEGVTTKKEKSPKPDETQEKEQREEKRQFERETERGEDWIVSKQKRRTGTKKTY